MELKSIFLAGLLSLGALVSASAGTLVASSEASLAGSATPGDSTMANSLDFSMPGETSTDVALFPDSSTFHLTGFDATPSAMLRTPDGVETPVDRPVPVPEPGTVALLGLAGLGLALSRSRKSTKNHAA